MREIIADGLEKVFGKNGCMEVVFDTLLKIVVVVAVGYLGVRMFLKQVDSSTIESLATPTVLSTPTETLILEQPLENGNNSNCVQISRDVPNAFRAWLELGKPDQVDFFNLAGPDGDPNDKGKRIIDEEQDGLIDDLTRLVHYRDKFCVP